MEYYIVSFRVRAHTVKLYQSLIERGVRAEIVSTPKEAGVGCGLSVKFDKGSFYFVKRAVYNLSLSSFAGYFLVQTVKGMRSVKSI